MIRKNKVFIDSDIPMYASGREHPNKIPSIKILELVSKGEIMGITSTEVMQEILYRYQAIGILDKGFDVFDNFSSIMDDVLPINLQIISEARNILGSKDIFPRDAVHIATMDYYEISYVASFDKHFRAFKHIRYYRL